MKLKGGAAVDPDSQLEGSAHVYKVSINLCIHSLSLNQVMYKVICKSRLPPESVYSTNRWKVLESCLKFFQGTVLRYDTLIVKEYPTSK